jgi:hypothetical protein
VRRPVDRVDAEDAEQPVDQPEVAAEQLAEHDPHGRDRGHVRDEYAHPEERARVEALVQPVRDEEREGELRDGRDEEDAERVEYRVPEPTVGQYLPIVVEPDKAAVTADEIPAAQRHPQRVPEREEPEDREQYEERRDVHVRRVLEVGAGQ